MTKESNLLILDEPTNDLDLETLDLLQEVIAEYQGTVLLISHDRDFLNRTVETSIILTGQGKFLKIAGSWNDYQSLKIKNSTPNKVKEKINKRIWKRLQILSLLKRRDILLLITQVGATANFNRTSRIRNKKAGKFFIGCHPYLEHPLKFEKASTALIERQTELKNLEDEWFVLEERGS